MSDDRQTTEVLWTRDLAPATVEVALSRPPGFTFTPGQRLADGRFPAARVYTEAFF